jgi:hypothetical protein
MSGKNGRLLTAYMSVARAALERVPNTKLKGGMMGFRDSYELAAAWPEQIASAAAAIKLLEDILLDLKCDQTSKETHKALITRLEAYLGQ